MPWGLNERERGHHVETAQAINDLLPLLRVVRFARPSHLVGSVTLFATRREVVSVPPPGGLGEIRGMGLSGKVCALTTEVVLTNATSDVRRTTLRTFCRRDLRMMAGGKI